MTWIAGQVTTEHKKASYDQSGEHSNHVVNLPTITFLRFLLLLFLPFLLLLFLPFLLFPPKVFFSTGEFFFNRGVFFFNRGVFFQPRSFLFALQLLLHLAVNPICFSCLNAAVLGLGLLNPPFKPLPFSPNHP